MGKLEVVHLKAGHFMGLVWGPIWLSLAGSELEVGAKNEEVCHH